MTQKEIQEQLNECYEIEKELTDYIKGANQALAGVIDRKQKLLNELEVTGEEEVH